MRHTIIIDDSFEEGKTLLEHIKFLLKKTKAVSLESGSEIEPTLLGMEISEPELIEHRPGSDLSTEEEFEHTTLLPLSESSLANEWLSPEDDVWDEFFEEQAKEA